MRLHGVRRGVEDNDFAKASAKDLIVPFCDGPQMQIASGTARKATELRVSTEFRYWNRYLLTLDRREFARLDLIILLGLAHRVFLRTQVSTITTVAE
jgi:hypothetical protein